MTEWDTSNMNNKGICMYLKAGKNKNKNLRVAWINKLGDMEMEHTTNDIKNIYVREREREDT